MMSSRVLAILALGAGLAACASVPETSSVASVCPWVGSEGDDFNGPTGPSHRGFGERVIGKGVRETMGDVASLVRQASECGWSADLKHAGKSEDGVAFEIWLTR
jgi:hypothetical protein